MKIIVCCVLLILAVSAIRVENHFYSTPSATCGVTAESSRYFHYQTGTCYVNRTLIGVLDCASQINCLDQQLEWDVLEDCYATAINATLGDFGGSFRISSNESGHYREQFVSSDCTGNFDVLDLIDNCDLNACSGDLARLQRFPQRLSISIPSVNSIDDDDDVSLTKGGTIGISVLASLLALALGGICLCAMVVIVLVVLVVIFGSVTIFFLVTTYIRYKNEMDDSDEEKKDPEEDEEKDDQEKDEEAADDGSQNEGSQDGEGVVDIEELSDL